MSQEWYYTVDGERQGPVPSAELKKLAEAGTLKPADLVWKDGMADWAPAKSIKGLFGGGSGAMPAPKTGEQPAAAARPSDETAEERPAARARPRDEEDEDDRPARRRRDEDEEEEDRPRSRRRDDDDEEDERPSRAVRRRDEDDEEDEDDRPVRRRRDDDEDEDDRPRRRGRIGPRELEEAKSKKMVAGLLGILLGGLAIHKFYLGYTGTAVIQLVISIFTCGLAGWIGLIEGILYLTKSDEDFYRDYIQNEKQWF